VRHHLREVMQVEECDVLAAAIRLIAQTLTYPLTSLAVNGFSVVCSERQNSGSGQSAGRPSGF